MRILVDVFPPPRKKVTTLKAYVDAFSGQRIEESKIYAHWERGEGRPMYTDQQISYIAGVLDSNANVQNLVNTSGEITEASAANIATYTQLFLYPHAPMLPFADLADASSTVVRGNALPRRFNVALTEAGGAIAATTIVPALSGYTGHAAVQGVWAPAGTADASNQWTFTVAAGTILGADVFEMVISANRYHNFTVGVTGIYGPPVLMRGTVAADDNKAIQVEAANLANVGTTYWIDGIYWYET